MVRCVSRPPTHTKCAGALGLRGALPTESAGYSLSARCVSVDDDEELDEIAGVVVEFMDRVGMIEQHAAALDIECLA